MHGRQVLRHGSHGAGGLGQTLAQTPGPIGAIGQFLLFKSLDVPGIDMYVAGPSGSSSSMQASCLPGEGDQPPPPPQPDPVKMAQAQHHIGQAALAQARAQDIQAKQAFGDSEERGRRCREDQPDSGHEADGHQTMIQNAQALQPMAPAQPIGTVVPRETPLQVNTGDYQGGF